MALIKLAILFLAVMVALGLWGTWKRLRRPAFCAHCGTALEGRPRCPKCGARA